MGSHAMLKFFGQYDDRVLVGIGLSRKDMVTLLAGHPIKFPLDAPIPAGLGFPAGIDLVLMGGETEIEIAQELQRLTGFVEIIVRGDAEEKGN